MGDFYGKIADPLDVVVDLENGDYEPKVGSHRLVKGKHFEAVLLDILLKYIDCLVHIDYLPRQIVIPFINGALGADHVLFNHG